MCCFQLPVVTVLYFTVKPLRLLVWFVSVYWLLIISDFCGRLTSS